MTFLRWICRDPFDYSIERYFDHVAHAIVTIFGILMRQQQGFIVAQPVSRIDALTIRGVRSCELSFQVCDLVAINRLQVGKAVENIQTLHACCVVRGGSTRVVSVVRVNGW